MGIFPQSFSERKWRRRIFTIWIAITIVAALYVGIAAPFVTAFGADKRLLALVVPLVMILLLGIGVAWLLTFATGGTRSHREKTASGKTEV